MRGSLPSGDNDRSHASTVVGLAAEFRQALDDDAAPRVLEFLERVPDEHRAVLLAQILPLEMAGRKSRGERVDVSDYLPELSAYRDIVEAVLARSAVVTPSEDAAASVGSPDSAVPESAVPDSSSHGASSHGASSHGASSHGASSHGASSHGAASRGAATDDTSEHGSDPHATEPPETMPPPDTGADDMSSELVISTVGHQGDDSAIIAGPRTARDTIGDYRLLNVLGRGGMGVVYRAQQISANRTVALKVVRPDKLEGISPAQRSHLLERFMAEAQATARLEHENLVTVYDVGRQGNECYYSMRYVEGASLAELLKDGPMDNHRIARYVEPIARAVHEAHKNGILHRDLKPHNILVEKRGDRPLVADFGLVKLQEGAGRATETGDMLGSPSYVSPEQTRDASKVTAATDVYGLGATLYHMLTGRPPFQASSLAATIRQVNEDEPIPPQRLNPAADLDLQTICLKCLEKEPLRRYASAEELADELLRFRRGVPIHARPVSGIARGWRWSRRNPLLSGLFGLAAVLMVLVSLASVYALSTNRTLARTLAERAELLETERAARERADHENERARSNFRALKRAVISITNHPALKHREAAPLSRALLEPSLRALQELANQPATDDVERVEQGISYSLISLLQAASGEGKQADAAADQARTLLASAANLPPDADKLVSDAFEAMISLGEPYHAARRFADARKIYQAAIDLYAPFEEQNLTNYQSAFNIATAYGNLGVTWTIEGKPKEAIGPLERSIAMRRDLLDQRPDHADNVLALATAFSNLSNAYSDSGDMDRAGKALQDGIAILSSSSHTQLDSFRGLLSTFHYQLGKIHFDEGNLEQALDSAELAVPVLEELIADFPGNREYPLRLAASRQLAAEAYRLQGDPGNAVKEAEAAIAVLDEHRQRNGPSGAIEFQSMICRTTLATCYMHLDPNRSVQEFRAAAESLESFVAGQPQAIDLRRSLGNLYFNLGLVLYDLGEHEAARTAFRSCLTHREVGLSISSDVVQDRQSFVDALRRLAIVQIDLEQPDETEATLARMQEALELLDADDDHRNVGLIQRAMLAANVCEFREQYDAALAEYTAALAVAERANKAGPLANELWELLVRCHTGRAIQLQMLARPADAEAAWIEATGVATRVLARVQTPETTLLTYAAEAHARAATFFSEQPGESAAARTKAFGDTTMSLLMRLFRVNPFVAPAQIADFLAQPFAKVLRDRGDVKSFTSQDQPAGE